MKVRITVRKGEHVQRFTCPAAQAARMVANLSGMGFEVVSVEAR